MVVNTEVNTLWPKAGGATNPARTTRAFNADLVLFDAQGTPLPYLAESLPQLGTDSWEVFPDGRMETTWTLRPGLTWHDGEPLTADDFAFAFRVYAAPEFAGIFLSKPQDIIADVAAIDTRTIRVSWRSWFLHLGDGLNPLPRHLLSEAFSSFERDPAGQRDLFRAQRFWTTDYIGAGPFRLTGWEPASHLSGEAFDGHALGRPKIDRIEIRIMNNEMAVLAAMMAGQAHMTTSIVLRVGEANTLREQGGFNDVARKGTVLLFPTGLNAMVFQHRAEYQQTAALLDVRVRRALVHATDREAISERLFARQAGVPVSMVLPTAPYMADVERTVTRYPYDPKRTEQIMAEVGYRRDREGMFVNADGQRLQPSLWNSPDSQHQVTAAIVLSTWQGAGVDVQPFAMSPTLDRDNQARSTFPGLLIHSVGGGESMALGISASEQISSPASRWNGLNRGGWSNPEYDLAVDRYNNTLDRGEQVLALEQAMKIHGDQVPNFPLHYNLQVVSHVAALKGPQAESAVWNLHEWEWL